MTVTGLDDQVKGTQCIISIEAGATLDTQQIDNLKVTSSQSTTTLNVVGTLHAAEVTMEADGK